MKHLSYGFSVLHNSTYYLMTSISQSESSQLKDLYKTRDHYQRIQRIEIDRQ